MLNRDEKRPVDLESTARETRLGQLPDRFRSAHGIERACDKLCRPCLIHVVRGLRFEQFGMGKDDPELIVQAVKEQPEVGVDCRTITRTARVRPARVCTGR